MISAGPPADLVAAVNEPVPLRVICEILGVPYGDHALFHRWVDVATNFGEQTEDNFQHAMADFREYMEDVVAAKRREQLIATVRAATDLSAAQRRRLAGALAESYGHPVHLNVVIDPTVLGGISVQIGDELIDGTAATRLAAVRRRLAS